MVRAARAELAGWLRWKPGHPTRLRPRTSRADQATVAKVVQSWSAPPSPPWPGPLPGGWAEGRRDDQASAGRAQLRAYDLSSNRRRAGRMGEERSMLGERLCACGERYLPARRGQGGPFHFRVNRVTPVAGEKAALMGHWRSG